MFKSRLSKQGLLGSIATLGLMLLTTVRGATPAQWLDVSLAPQYGGPGYGGQPGPDGGEYVGTQWWPNAIDGNT